MNEVVSNHAENPYAAPQHLGTVVDHAGPRRFYVVSARKFLCLYIATMGLYGYYWYYSHWAAIRRVSRGSEWPVARAIFSIFFVGSLTEEIDLRLRRQSIAFPWSAKGTANTIVLVALVSYFAGRASGMQEQVSPLDYAVFVLVPIAGAVKLKAQRAANAACEDPDGTSNATFGAGAIVAMVLGCLFWLLVLASTGAILFLGE